MPPLFIAGYDGSDRGDDAVALASALARVHDARLVVAHVERFDPSGRVEAEGFESELREESKRVVERARRLVENDGFHTRLVTATSRARGLHQLAQAEGASLIVVGSSHRGPVGRVFVGTVGDRLLNGAPCPIGIAPAGFATGDRALRVVGVAFDGGEEARAAARASERLARRLGATLRIVAVINWPPYVSPQAQKVPERARAALEHVVAQMPRDLVVEQEVREGDPTEELLKACEDGIDLLVAGSRAYGPIGSVLLGSVSHQLVREVPCPIVVTPRTATETLDGPAIGIEESVA